MITFTVSKELHGWAVRTSGGSMTPFWSKDVAMTRAQALAAMMRGRGQRASVEIAGEVEAEHPSFSPRQDASPLRPVGTA